MSNDITDIIGHDLLDHSNVPDLENTIRVARTDVLSANRELSVIDGVQMAVESLHSQACSHIPDGQGAISGATHEEVGEGLEVKAVY